MKHELDIYLEAKGRQYRELNERELLLMEKEMIGKVKDKSEISKKDKSE